MVFPNRFTVFCDYDGSMVKFFNDIEKRFWDAPFKTWSLPSSAYDKVMRYFASRNLAYETYSVDCIIYQCDTEILFKFNNWFSNQDALLTLTDVSYDKGRKVFSVSSDQLEALKDVLDSEDRTYVARDIRTPVKGIPVDPNEQPKKNGFAAYKRPVASYGNPFQCSISPL